VRELSEGTRVRDLWASLGHEVPLFARFRAMPPAAVNREYVSGETVLQDGDEVAFLPRRGRMKRLPIADWRLAIGD